MSTTHAPLATLIVSHNNHLYDGYVLCRSCIDVISADKSLDTIPFYTRASIVREFSDQGRLENAHICDKCERDLFAQRPEQA